MKKVSFFHFLLYAAWGLVGSLPFSCSPADAVEKVALPLFEVITPEISQLSFVNSLKESPTQNVLTYEYFYNGGGVAVADFNGDDLPDIYLVANLSPNHLYLNQGAFRFQDISTISQTQGTRGFATGVSIVDINADGLLDIYLCKSGRFTNPDLRRNELFINQGNNAEGIPVFKESARQYGLDIPGYSTQAAFFDYDKDGDLDAFVINHGIDTYALEDIEQLQQEQDPHIGEMLLRNDQNRFVDVTASAGIIRNKLGYGLGIGIGDLNNDSYPDIYVSNDYSGKDHLYINQKDGQFKECIRELTSQTSFYAMGNDIGDINNDGWQDIVNLDMVASDNYGIKTSMSAMNPAQFTQLVELGEHHQYMFNSLLLNNGSPSSEQLPLFSNIGQLAGISNTDWSWGPLLFDMDNDGWQDIFISNGIKRNIRNNDAQKVVKQLNQQLLASTNEQEKTKLMGQMLQQFPYHRKANYFFRNTGDLGFEDISAAFGMDTLLTASNGAAYADFDLDGDLDLIINNVDQAALLLKNNSTESSVNQSLSIRLNGPALNPFGIGAKVVLESELGRQVKEVYTSRGYQSAMEPKLHFGLGTINSPNQLRVIWPDGKEQQISNVPSGSLELNYQHAEYEQASSEAIPPLFRVTPSELSSWKHQENAFPDFERESLLPHRMSNMGPAASSGDVNGDGRIDLFIGGAKGQPAVLFVQEARGTFIRSQAELWESEKEWEDVAALFFDPDQDGDSDLLIGSGSNEWAGTSTALRLRFYENRGGGNFIKNTNAFPGITASVGVLTAGDIDQDGDVDLFVGGRQSPGNYPQPCASYLLENTSQPGQIQFLDRSQEWAPYLEHYGMVTDAVWVDVNQDNRPDLVTVGEWMAPEVLMNTSAGFTKEPANNRLGGETGWWYAIEAADIDGDGDMDLVGGNLGLNYKYKASVAQPFEIYGNDFDTNGSLDIVLSYQEDGQKVPLRGRECSSGQMPFIKEKFASYDAFGKASLADIFEEAKLDSATHYEARNFAHCYFENDGNGDFIVHALPVASQVSSINSLLIKDFDQDGHLDILAAGNLLGAEVETPRNDAGHGFFLKGDGNGKFIVNSATESGLQLKGEVKALLPISNQTIVVVKNNASPQQLVNDKILN